MSKSYRFNKDEKFENRNSKKVAKKKQIERHEVRNAKVFA